jgi:ABC-type branched-subunit amino acid transport system substrate-binding protein
MVADSTFCLGAPASRRRVARYPTAQLAGETPAVPGKKLRNRSWALLIGIISMVALNPPVVWLGTAVAAEAETLKIGVLLPPEEPQAHSVQEGVLLAKEEANKTNTKPLDIIIRGRVGQWGADGAEAARMVTEDGVDGLIAPPDGAATHPVLAGPGRLQCADFGNAAGDALDGFIVPAIVRPAENTTRLRSFQTAYHQRWGHLPDTMAAMSYDAAMLLSHLFSRPEFQMPPHRLTPGFSWPGVTGDMAFDTEGNRAVQLELLQTHEGKFTSIPKAK